MKTQKVSYLFLLVLFIATGHFSHSLYAQYCVPIHSDPNDYTASFVTTGAITNVNYTSTSQQGTQGYNNLSSNSSYQISTYAGGSFNFVHQYGSTMSSYPHSLAIWIDYEGNGDFLDANETVFHGYSIFAEQSGTISIPSSVSLGSYRMRLRSRWSTQGIQNIDPCEHLSYGQVLDFTVTVLSLPPCSGTPNAGTVIITPATTNGGDSYKVTAAGQTFGSGMTYIWEKSTNGGSTWTQAYSGSTYAPLNNETAPMGVGSSVHYRLKVACGSNQVTSNSGIFTTSKTYCEAIFSNLRDYFGSFSTTGALKNISYSSSATMGIDGHYDLTMVAAYHIRQNAGGSFNFSSNYIGGGNALRIWVDWNNNGSFEDSEQVTYLHYNAPDPKTGTITIPSGQPNGAYRMRVRGAWGLSAYPMFIQACNGMTYGQTLDLTLIVGSLPSCSGVPNPGTLFISTTSGNAGSNYSVFASGGSVNSGLTYTWQKSLNGGISWTTVGTANTSTYAHLMNEVAPPLGDSVQYRLLVACGSNTNTSNIVQFKTAVVYCTPVYTATVDYTSAFSTTNGPSANNASYTASGQPAGGYVDLTSDPNQKIIRSAADQINFTHTYVGGNNRLAIWVDWNKDGTFDPGNEQVYNVFSTALTKTNWFFVPNNQPAGTYRMRVRSSFGESANPNPCESVSWGTALDFSIEIVAAPCTVNAGTISNVASLCVGATQTLTSSVGGGSWYSETPGIASVHASSGLVTGLAGGTATIGYIVTDANNSGCKDTVTVSFLVNALPNAGTLTASSSSVCKDATITLIPSVSGGTWSANNTNVSVSGGVVTGLSVGSSIITYTVTQNGCSSQVTQTLSVNPVPDAGFSLPTNSLCVGSSISATPNTANGSWSSLNTTVAVVSNGVVTPLSPGSAGIVYTVVHANGCVSSHTVSVTVVNALSAGTLSIPTELCFGNNSVTASSTVSGGLWSSSAVGVATIDPVSGSIATVATGTVTFTYTIPASGSCASASASQTVTIKPLPDAGFSLSTNSLCVGSSILATPNTANGSWSSLDTNVAKVSNNGTITPVGAGSAGIVYTVVHANGCVNSHTSFVSVVNALSAGTLSIPTELCFGNNSVTASSTVSGGLWSSSAVGVATIDPVSGSIATVAAGTVTFTYTIPSSGSCASASVSQTVTIKPSPNAGTLTASAESVCVGSTITLTPSVSGGTWSVDANASIIGGLVMGNSAGVAVVTYTITQNGCSNQVTKTISVYDVPNAGTLTASSDSVCIGSAITLTPSVSGGTWAVDDHAGVVAGVVTGLSAGTATITYIVSVNGCSSLVSKTIQVVPPSVVSIAGDSALQVGASSLYVGLPAGGTWSSSDDSLATIDNLGQLNALKQGVVSLIYTVENEAPCSGFVSDTLVVSISQPGGGGNMVGLKDLESIFDVQLFPNPTRNDLQVELSLFENTDLVVRVIDLHGEILQTRKFESLAHGSHILHWDVSSYSDGVYSVEFSSHTFLHTTRFVIAR